MLHIAIQTDPVGVGGGKSEGGIFVDDTYCFLHDTNKCQQIVFRENLFTHVCYTCLSGHV